MTIRETIFRPTQYASWISDCIIQSLDLKAASVADLALGKWEAADIAIAVEAECGFQMGASRVEGTVFVGDGDFFSCFDITDCVDGFTLCIGVPIVVRVWKTAVIYEANGRIDAANHGVTAAGQSICFGNTAEWVFTRRTIVKRKELPLLVF